MRRYGLRDDQWQRIEHLLPGREDTVGVTAKDNRLFVEAVIYRYRAGIPWRDLPERFGDWNNIARRHKRWSDSGVWQRVFEHLAADADNEYAMIDSTIVRAHQHAAGAKGGTRRECIGRSKGGLTTKIHATCDALGNLTGFHLTPGQAHDLQGADALLPDILCKVKAFLADKAYDAAERVLDLLDQKAVKAVIPPKSNRTQQREYDEDMYTWRHLIENFFQKLKQYRAIATRYDKRASTFLGAIYMAASVI
ncbi:IS5 family transposase [Nitrosomonas sp. Nm33]|uniref:IS5 family transposase n=1 Tax=Nitrosomonas sp. Nm33 TaxID=133724 RepID=UPI0021098C1C|nr:IS5 family transposase [Nitrosomonas sp. Nm33]